MKSVSLRSFQHILMLQCSKFSTFKGITWLRNGCVVFPNRQIHQLTKRADECGEKRADNHEYAPHIPVMLNEVLSLMDPSPGQTVIDMTCGSGGHTEPILNCNDSVRVYGLDRDPVAHKMGIELSIKYPDRFRPLLGRFSEAAELLRLNNVTEVDGIFFDLGCSSMQFDDAKRGFAISRDGPLDMRMDGNRYSDQPTAADVIEHIDEHHLARILKVYGEEKQAKKIARAIVEARYLFKSLKSTSELASLVASVLDNEIRLDKLARPTHGATKTFQALRIFVNNEMNELHEGLQIAHDILKPGGKLITLTFHSLEDRIVKRNLTGIDMDEPVSKSMSQKYRNAASWHDQKELEKIFDKKWKVVNKHVLVPSFEEVQKNPRSRSAKLRCAIAVK